MNERFWKVGELARVTGLTVRTLHHYDEIGLLVPSGRTEAGYRLYGDADVRRLYTILALRDLHLPLNEIGLALDAGIDPRTIMRRHLEYVDHQIDVLKHLRQRIAHVLAEGSSGESSMDDYTRILEARAMAEKYYTPEQLEALEARRNELGEEGMKRAEREWADLIAAVRQERDAGTDPTDPRMLDLARRWRGLIDQFTGGDAGIQQSLVTMYRTEGPERASRGAVDAELMVYVGKALEAAG